MIEQIQLLLLGFAAIFDLVLLLILLERVNASQVAIWLKLLIAGTLAAHAASFFQVWLYGFESSAAIFLGRGCMFVMSGGLLLLPSAMLHAAIRLNHTGAVAHPRVDRRYVILYAPLLSLPFAAMLAFHGNVFDFIGSFEPMKWPYIIWLTTANLAAIFLFLRVRKQPEFPHLNSFYMWHSLSLFAMTLLAIGYFSIGYDSWLRSSLRLMTILSPLAPLFLFVWYSIRTRLLSLVMERTLVYGALFFGLLLLHRATISPMIESAQSRSKVDLALVELACILGVVLVWKPLRMRVRESLRYLLSRNVFQVRDATRLLSVQLSHMGTLPTLELIESFRVAVKNAIAVQFVRIDLDASPQDSVRDRDMSCLRQLLSSGATSVIVRGWKLDPLIRESMERLDAMWAFRLRFGLVDGIVLLGPRSRCDRLADEQLAALSVLFEQFAVTLNNRLLDEQRLRAERKAMQQDKLSVLGLLAGSLAHELRNPLSSIRTIASLILEESSDDSHARNDVAVILAEIDRLMQTTQRLLEFARPSDHLRQSVEPDRVIERLLHILGHLAKQLHVDIDTSLTAGDACVTSTDAALSEILFNLIRNAIEASQGVRNAKVHIQSRVADGCLVISVSDNGPGIDPAVQQFLFQPFVTSKQMGTGLGLYVASERVRELRGKLHCESVAGRGTIFTIELPQAGFTIELPQAGFELSATAQVDADDKSTLLADHHHSSRVP